MLAFVCMLCFRSCLGYLRYAHKKSRRKFHIFYLVMFICNVLHWFAYFCIFYFCSSSFVFGGRIKLRLFSPKTITKFGSLFLIRFQVFKFQVCYFFVVSNFLDYATLIKAIKMFDVDDSSFLMRFVPEWRDCVLLFHSVSWEDYPPNLLRHEILCTDFHLSFF